MRRERRMNPKCLGKPVPDTFSARSAHLTGLKMRRITRDVSFDHLVGAQQDRRRQIDTDRRGGLQIHHHLELRRLLDRQIGGLGAVGDPINELSNAPEERCDTRPVAQQAARIHPFAEDKHG